MPFGQGMGIRLYGTEGVLHYDLAADRIFGSTRRDHARAGKPASLPEIPIPAEKARPWQVEADFVEAIRTGKPIELTPFEVGVAYMEFTEAVARSAQRGEAVELPLEEFIEEGEGR
jgi:predicted dehydrogenase